MEDQSGDQMRDHWLYDVIVFFLLLPFTILVSYALGSLIGVGFGVALVAWRVAETPEITNPVSLRVRRRARESLRGLVVGLVAGFSLLGVIDFATRITLTNHLVGFPLSYAQPVSGCASPGWPLGCPIVYDSVNIMLDYLFWAGVAFAFVSILRVGWIHRSRDRSHSS